MQLQIDITQKRAHESAQELAMKSYLQTYIEEYRRVFEAEVDRLYKQWKEQKQEGTSKNSSRQVAANLTR
jgi:hypothetical protein